MSRHRRAFGLAAVGIAAMLVLPTSALATSTSVGWLLRPGPPPVEFVSSSIVTVSGPRDDDGICEGLLTLQHPAGQPPMAAVEVAANPSTCQQEVQIGVVSGPDPAALQSDGYSTASSVASGGFASPATSQRSGYYYAIWADPADIQLTEVEENMTWGWTGSTVTSASGYDYRHWFSTDGWTETGHKGPYLDNNGTDAVIWTDDVFYNQPFCGGTWTTYQAINYFGYAGGTDVGVVRTWDYGCDASLLWYYTYLF